MAVPTWMTAPAGVPATGPWGGQKLLSLLCAELAAASVTLIWLSATSSGRGFSLSRLLSGCSRTLSLYCPAVRAFMLITADLPPVRHFQSLPRLNLI